MSFAVFQTVTATMLKVTTDGYGDESTTSFTVDIDPVLGRKRVFSNSPEGSEEVTGLSTVISPHDSIDLTVDNWKLTYNGRTYQVEQLLPVYDIGTTTISHYEVVLR